MSKDAIQHSNILKMIGTAEGEAQLYRLLVSPSHYFTPRILKAILKKAPGELVAEVAKTLLEQNSVLNEAPVLPENIKNALTSSYNSKRKTELKETAVALDSEENTLRCR
jgi:hypothetical protein